MFSNNFLPNSASKFYCENCDYGTFKKSSFDTHLISAKHKKSMISNEIQPNSASKYICQNCSKTYKDNSGLWRHKQKCKVESDDDDESENKVLSNEPSDKQLIMMLIKDNNELRTMMMKVLENGTHNTTNSHNKAFNLNFFLNETCKDAMNIMDFVDSIKLQLSDLESVGEMGFVDGISNIIVNKLKDLDITERPVHCTDKKREVLYIKDENKWEKENEDKTKIRKAIKHIAHKNSRLIPQFKEKHPDCGKSNSKYCDQYSKLIIEAMGGNGENDMEKENKIIKKISREIIVDKES
jgi:hypothetical protein